MNNHTYSVHSPFNVVSHKATFINYLEVIILEDGTIEYAVPSHQEKLIAIACNKFQITRQELDDLCPKEFYLDFMKWLCNITNCVTVYNEFTEGRMNLEQLHKLIFLKSHGLYSGHIPNVADLVPQATHIVERKPFLKEVW